MKIRLEPVKQSQQSEPVRHLRICITTQSQCAWSLGFKHKTSRSWRPKGSWMSRNPADHTVSVCTVSSGRDFRAEQHHHITFLLKSLLCKNSIYCYWRGSWWKLGRSGTSGSAIDGCELNGGRIDFCFSADRIIEVLFPGWGLSFYFIYTGIASVFPPWWTSDWLPHRPASVRFPVREQPLGAAVAEEEGSVPRKRR